MKEKFNHILAKSKKNGGTTLIDHLKDVEVAATKFAQYLDEDVEKARKGALLHDIGKASTIFQKRLKDEKKDILQEPFRHELASLFFISFIDESERDDIIEMVVAHHKSIWSKEGSKLGILDFDEEDDDFGFELHIKDWEQWKDDAIGILKYLGFKTYPLSIAEAKANYNYSVKFCKKKFGVLGWSKWKGLLVGADQFASCFIEKTKEIADKSFINPDLSFYNRKCDLYPLSKIETDNPTRHTIVTAPTGAGKTDFLIRRCKGRFFYTLPFQASINTMYQRIKTDLKESNPDLDIRVMHAASRLVIEKGKIEEKALQDKFGASVKVLTPHQLASLAFGTRGFELIMLDIKGCDVILDEIHTYTDISKAMVLKIIEVLNYLGCKIHIGTATMPTKLYNEILEILGKDETYEVKLNEKLLDKFNRHEVYKIPNDFEQCDALIKQALERKGKVLVVFNQVQRAQDFYKTLNGNTVKMLIHSRFRRKDRKVLENDLSNISDNNTEGCIVVSTQVVEVSLDINFDIMITECAPLDALVQRFGRINRKRTPKTIGKYKSVYVLEPPKTKKDARPYELSILEKSYNVLPNGALLKEKDLQDKLDTVFTDFENIDIENDTIFKKGKFVIRGLTHKPKSALFNLLDIDSATCIRQSDVEEYKQLSSDERIALEIPVRFKEIGFIKGIDRLKDVGTDPFIIPNTAYTEGIGLETAKILSQ